MTYCAPLRAGTPKLPAAGPERNVTMPSLKVSCAEAGTASPSDVTATDANRTARLVRRRRFMFSSPDSTGVPVRLSAPFCPGIGHWDEFRQAFTARPYALGPKGRSG